MRADLNTRVSSGEQIVQKSDLHVAETQVEFATVTRPEFLQWFINVHSCETAISLTKC